jgi:putative NADPH-quinone reductase
VRVLVVFAHPQGDSLNGAIRDRVIAALHDNGHEIDLCDLYAEGFEPVLSAAERAAYFDVEANRARNAGYVDRLFAAEALVFIFPTWTLGPPAILKGFFDRVMVPGVSFRLDKAGALHPNLRHIKRLAAIVTYGRSRTTLWWFGDPPRKMFTRYMPWFLARGANVRYLGLYDLHCPQPRRIGRFLSRVEGEMARF